MDRYIYQDWNRAYFELQDEEDTLWYYTNFYKSPNNEHGNLASQQAAKQFLKDCESAEDWARFAYEDQTLIFQVCKMDAHHVEAYMEVNRYHGQANAVYFLDEENRVFMHYWFTLQPDGRYFLSEMMFWEYIEGKTGEDDYTKSWQYNFAPDGQVAVIVRTEGAKQEEVWNSKEPLNLSSNWQSRPAFGNWDGFFTMKRWKEGEIDAIRTF